MVQEISRDIKALARELEVPVICAAQLNRGPADRATQRPRMSDLRESGSIEQDADLVGLLYKPSEGEDEDGAVTENTDSRPVNLLIAKQRNGPTGDVKLTFFNSYTRFESAAKFSEEDVPGNR